MPGVLGSNSTRYIACKFIFAELRKLGVYRALNHTLVWNQNYYSILYNHKLQVLHWPSFILLYKLTWNIFLSKFSKRFCLFWGCVFGKNTWWTLVMFTCSTCMLDLTLMNGLINHVVDIYLFCLCKYYYRALTPIELCWILDLLGFFGLCFFGSNWWSKWIGTLPPM